MSKKSFIMFLVLSVLIWYVSRIVQALTEMFVLNNSSLSLFPTSVAETGYPIAFNLSQTSIVYYLICVINIILWFFVLFGISRLIKKKTTK